MRLTKLLIEYFDEEGNKFRRVLDGEEVIKWHEQLVKLCQFAEERSANPKWEELRWSTEKIMTKVNHKNSVLLSEIIDYDKIKK